MKRFLKSSLSLLLAITIIFSSAYVGLSEVDWDGLFAVEAKATDYSQIYKDELVYMDARTAKAFIGFIYNVPTDKISTDEESIDVIYNYLTGVYTKGTQEYIYAQSIFLLTSEAFINRNLNQNEKIFNISTQNLIDALEEEVGSDPNVAQDVLNEAVGGVKGTIKKILYYVGEFDLDETFTAIDTALSGYTAIVGIKGKVEDLVLAVKSVVNTTFAVTSNNAYKSYKYYSVYLNNRSVGEIAIEPMLAGLAVDANFFDGLINVFDSIGFGNSWTNEEIQYLIRCFAEFTYHSKCEIQQVSNCQPNVDNTIDVVDISLGVSYSELGMNQTVNVNAQVYPTSATNKSLKYSSTNSNIVKVSSDGTVTPVGEGIANIIVTAHNGVQKHALIKVYPFNMFSNSITKYLGSNSNVIIPTAINGVPIIEIGEEAFLNNGKIKSVVIPESVSRIRQNAFNNCNNLVEIELLGDVGVVDANAFAGCELLRKIKITDLSQWFDIKFQNAFANPLNNGGELFLNDACVDELVVPDNIVDINEYVFYGCSSFKIITIPDTVKSMGAYSFANNTNLANVTIGSGVSNISSYAFYGCSKLNSVELGNSIKMIDQYAFAKCSSISCFQIPDSTEKIEFGAFMECVSLSTVNIPKNVAYIGKDAFGKCSSLTKISVDDNNIAYSSENGVLFNKEKTTLILFPSKKNVSTYNVLSSVTILCDNAFYNCDYLKNVNLPAGLLIIGNECFSDCNLITKIEIPEGVTGIGSDAFSQCSKLVSVTIPESVVTIGGRTFYSCKALTQINWSFIHSDIPDGMFEDCTSLSEIEIPEGVKVIDVDAFRNCSALKTVVIPSTCYKIMGDKGEGFFPFKLGAFMNCSALTTITIPAGMSIIEEYAFYNCTSIQNVNYLGALSEWDKIIIGSGNENLVTAQVSHKCSYGGWVNVVEVTCTEDGVRQRKCTRCGDIVTEIIKATGHDYSSDWIIDIPVSCTEDGSKSHHCNACGNRTDITVIEAIGHDYSCDWVIDTPATCIKDGSKYKSCLNCDEEITETLTALGHNYSSEWIIDKAVSCTENGSKSHHCIRCEDKVDMTIIESTGHSMVDDICQVCGGSDVWEFVAYDDYAVVTIYSGSNTKVVIPDKYKGLPVTQIGEGAFAGIDTIKSVTIPENVTVIGDYVFYYCTELESITISDGVTSIGSGAFEECYNLTSVTLSDKVTSIGEGAFKSPTSIRCYENSAAHTFAVDNGLDYTLVNIHSINDEVDVDYDNKFIRSFIELCTDAAAIISTSDNFILDVIESIAVGDTKIYGTGSKIIVNDSNGVQVDEYTMVVDGDTNGDSVCDALDAAQVALVSNGHKTIDGAYKMAADNNYDDIVDIEDYQAIVNKAIS